MAIRFDINGKTATKDNVTITPDSIASSILVSDQTAAYRFGADYNAENCFNGSIDFLRIYNNEAPTEKYSAKEIPPQPIEVIIGDVDFNGKINVFDLILVKRILISQTIPFNKILSACDIDGDEDIKINDVVLMQKYLTAQISEFPAGATKVII